MAYTFADAKATTRKKTQYFENGGSRGIYHDGWFACTFGPTYPWDSPSIAARLKTWDATKEPWELYDLSKDFSQANDLAVKEPERLAKMKELFQTEATENKVFPLGGGLWARYHPEDTIGSPYKSWRSTPPPPGCRSSPPRRLASGAITSPLISRWARTPPACSTPSVARAAA